MSSFCSYSNKNEQNYKYVPFLMDKDSISWRSECFVAVLLTLFDFDASYLHGYICIVVFGRCGLSMAYFTEINE